MFNFLILPELFQKIRTNELQNFTLYFTAFLLQIENLAKYTGHCVFTAVMLTSIHAAKNNFEI